jgi:hypothetical protein
MLNVWDGYLDLLRMFLFLMRTPIAQIMLLLRPLNPNLKFGGFY